MTGAAGAAQIQDDHAISPAFSPPTAPGTGDILGDKWL